MRDPRDLQSVLQSVMGMLTTLLAGVAAVSLVVGGIGPARKAALRHPLEALRFE